MIMVIIEETHICLCNVCLAKNNDGSWYRQILTSQTFVKSEIDPSIFVSWVKMEWKM